MKYGKLIWFVSFIIGILTIVNGVDTDNNFIAGFGLLILIVLIFTTKYLIDD